MIKIYNLWLMGAQQMVGNLGCNQKRVPNLKRFQQASIDIEFESNTSTVSSEQNKIWLHCKTMSVNML